MIHNRYSRVLWMGISSQEMDDSAAGTQTRVARGTTGRKGLVTDASVYAHTIIKSMSMRCIYENLRNLRINIESCQPSSRDSVISM